MISATAILSCTSTVTALSPIQGWCAGELVRSKWGAVGHVWDHPLFEVPSGYGTRVRYFAPVALANAIDAYRDFVKRPRFESQRREAGREPL